MTPDANKIATTPTLTESQYQQLVNLLQKSHINSVAGHVPTSNATWITNNVIIGSSLNANCSGNPLAIINSIQHNNSVNT